MRNIKKAMRVIRILLFAFMLAVCMALGVAPVIPKREEENAVEIKMEEAEKTKVTTAKINIF